MSSGTRMAAGARAGTGAAEIEKPAAAAGPGAAAAAGPGARERAGDGAGAGAAGVGTGEEGQQQGNQGTSTATDKAQASLDSVSDTACASIGIAGAVGLVQVGSHLCGMSEGRCRLCLLTGFLHVFFLGVLQGTVTKCT